MTDNDYLMISGLQHYVFCPRQWALIHIEQQWAENARTADGHAFHRRAHDGAQTEKRGDLLITRGLRIFSDRLGVSGVCDVVEFHRADGGVGLFGWEGKWAPCPVEYKKGAPKEHDADELQLCCQAMCLEEMLACGIPRGSLFYGENRRRQPVDFTPEMRERVTAMLAQMHAYFVRGYTPEVRPGKGCNACSLKEICLPKLRRSDAVGDYLKQRAGEEA